MTHRDFGLESYFLFMRCRGFAIINVMFFKLKLLLQICIYALIVGIGCKLFYTSLRTPLPHPEEAPHLLTVAQGIERLEFSALPQGACAKVLPFHQLAGSFVQFISTTHPNGYRLRTYRIFPALFSVLFLLLLPALGLRRRGGCFETEDAPIWVALLVLTTPPFLCYGSLFTPLSFQALLFLGLLIAFRSYVQWPGYLSTLFIALFIAMSLCIDAQMAWVILLMIPAIALGVGWRRIRLYWHAQHFFVFTFVLLLSIAFGVFFNFITPPTPPSFLRLLNLSLEELSWRVIWLTAGGFGLVAWCAMLFWSIYHPDRRWAKCFTAMYPLFVIASLGFDKGGAFAVPVICLSLILSGMALSTLPRLHLRLMLGGSAVLALAIGMTQFLAQHFSDSLPSSQQRTVARELINASKPNNEWQKVCLQIEDPLCAARVVWPIRHSHLLPPTEHQSADLIISDKAIEGEHVHSSSAMQRTLPFTRSILIHLLPKNTL